MFKWYLAKIDVRDALLQAGSAQHDVYVIPPTESSDRAQYEIERVADLTQTRRRHVHENARMTRGWRAEKTCQ